MGFFKNLLAKLVHEGKLMLFYLLQEFLAPYPGVLEAVTIAFSNPSRENIGYALLQMLGAFGAGHRFIKIFKSLF